MGQRPSTLMTSKDDDPIKYIRYIMRHYGLKQKDMVLYMGSKSHVSEVLNYKRKLTLPMIRRLHDKFRIPASVLIKDYELEEPKK